MEFLRGISRMKLSFSDTRGGYSGSGSSNWRDPRQRSEAQERQPHYEEYRSSHYNSRERTYSRSKSGDEPGAEHDVKRIIMRHI